MTLGTRARSQACDRAWCGAQTVDIMPTNFCRLSKRCPSEPRRLGSSSFPTIWASSSQQPIVLVHSAASFYKLQVLDTSRAGQKAIMRSAAFWDGPEDKRCDVLLK